jgi:lipopolysaccharide transport system ATP-binding protein
MSNTVIKVENLGKLYRLGEISTGTISHDLNRWYAKVRGKEDPFAKVGEKNDRSVKGDSEYVWALKDISFEVKAGEVLGIIGRNGAGKSTLLKILSKVTTPSTGKIKIKGRIASLLEVGTGFHPELTGRENIFLNGAILGMTKREIKSKFDEIVDFAGVERYIDTPVKRYSSGMYVRLAFAVAAFLEPEILIIDEVLAVGDAEFQKKCLGRMKDVSTNDGRTVIFVSHNMPSVSSLCEKAILMKYGEINQVGSAKQVVTSYLLSQRESVEKFDLCDRKDFKGNGYLIFGSVSVNGNNTFEVLNNQSVEIEFELKNEQKHIGYAEIAGVIKNEDNLPIHYFSSKLLNKQYFLDGTGSFIKVHFDSLPFNEGVYFIDLEIKFNNEIVYHLNDGLSLKIIDGDFYASGTTWKNGYVLINQQWS